MGNPKTYLNGKKISGGCLTKVIANPTGTATETLETIQIGETIYELPSGGGSSSGSRDIRINTTATVTEEV